MEEITLTKEEMGVELTKAQIKGRCIARSVAWISTSIAVIAGIFVTKEPACLWAFLIPMMM